MAPVDDFLTFIDEGVLSSIEGVSISSYGTNHRADDLTDVIDTVRIEVPLTAWLTQIGVTLSSQLRAFLALHPEHKKYIPDEALLEDSVQVITPTTCQACGSNEHLTENHVPDDEDHGAEVPNGTPVPDDVLYEAGEL
jgi:hypothetical protein